MEYVLQATGLSKHYRGTKALDGLDIHVPKGSIYGLVGRNGAGKTTLIRLICGLQAPTEGSYTLCGQSSAGRGIARGRSRMGAVVETPAIYTDMTAEQNLREQYDILGLPSYEDIPELLRLVGLENAGRKKAGKFSLGMRQRLGIALALAARPDFLVLDEPTNGLDPQGIIEIRELVLKLNREHGITALISSHILDELARVATYYGFLDGGRMVREMSTAELDAACRKCMRVEVTDTKPLARVLDAMTLEYAILDERRADIYGKPSVSKLASALAAEGCELLTVTERDESLESFYLNLIGGGAHA